MNRYRQFDPVLISEFEVSDWQHPVHNHNHYELIYIKSGSGTHHVNQFAIAYHTGDIFLLGPEDEHYFQIEEQTHFIYLKFTDQYIHQESIGMESGLQNLEYLIKSRETHRSGFQLTASDQQTVDLLFNVIRSLKGDMFRNEQVIWMQLLSLATLLQRNMPELKSTIDRSRDMQAVFCYIHKHIYTPEMLRAQNMASHFNLAEDYIGPYFKRNTGITLRSYIRDYRSKLIQKRMLSGRYTLKQIAEEFGLTDESHVLKAR